MSWRASTCMMVMHSYFKQSVTKKLNLNPHSSQWVSDCNEKQNGGGPQFKVRAHLHFLSEVERGSVFFLTESTKTEAQALWLQQLQREVNSSLGALWPPAAAVWTHEHQLWMLWFSLHFDPVCSLTAGAEPLRATARCPVTVTVDFCALTAAPVPSVMKLFAEYFFCCKTRFKTLRSWRIFNCLSAVC